MKDNTRINLLGITSLFITFYFMRLLDFPNEFTVIIGGILCLLIIVKQKKIRIDLGICLLALTLVSYYVIENGIRGILYSILYIPLIIYFLGNASIFLDSDWRKTEEKLFWLAMAMVAGYTILGILNAYMYYAGYVIPGTRRWQDFWSHAIVPGTQHTAYFLPMFAMFFSAVIYFKERKILNSVLLILTVFFCYTSLATRSRMPLLIFVLVCFGQLILFALLEKGKVKKIISNKITWIIALIGIIFLGAGIFLIKDTEIVTNFIKILNRGGGILNNARFKGQRMALAQLFDYPMGGKQMEFGRLEEYCHNTWLDIANISGLIPFFSFTAYTIYTAYETIRVVLDKTTSARTKLIIAAMYITFLLYMTVEPALTASVHLLTPWVWMNGLTHGYLMLKKNSEQG